MKLKLALVASALAGVAACGASPGQAPTTTTLPACTTFTSPSGSVDVLRLQQAGATFTGTEAAGGATAKLSGAVTSPGHLKGFAQINAGLTLRIYGLYTQNKVWLFQGADKAYKSAEAGHATTPPFVTSNGCP